MTDFEPCTCWICAWLDTPKDQRTMTERQVIQVTTARAQSRRWEAEKPFLDAQYEESQKRVASLRKRLKQARP